MSFMSWVAVFVAIKALVSFLAQRPLTTQALIQAADVPATSLGHFDVVAFFVIFFEFFEGLLALLVAVVVLLETPVGTVRERASFWRSL